MQLTKEDCQILLTIINQIKSFSVKEGQRVGLIVDKLEIISQQASDPTLEVAVKK